MSSMEKRDRKKYTNISRMYASATQLPIDTNNYPCPCCGKKMHYVNGAELFGEEKGCKKDKYMVCYDCDIHGRVREQYNGAFLISVPAKRETRQLRNEAHYFFDKLYEYGIFANRTSAYEWLTKTMGRKRCIKTTQYHIGEMDDDKLRMTIQVSVEKLAEHPEKFPERILPFGSRGGSYSMSNQQISDKLNALNVQIGSIAHN